MAISSNTLFHFTPKAEYLISILRNEFQPGYCVEDIGLSDKVTKVAIPMVSFCDIPLSQIKNHVETYGVYGIGMNKEWANRNHLNPVLYLNKDSALTGNLREIYYGLKNLDVEEPEKLNIAKSSYLKLLRYIKPYQGDFLRSETLPNDVRFYDEREWRYTPEWTSDILKCFGIVDTSKTNMYL